MYKQGLSLLKKPLLLSYLRGRSLLYLLESFPIYNTHSLLATPYKSDVTKEQILAIKEEVEDLFKKDVNGFLRGDYPYEVLNQSNVFKHSKSYLKLVADNISIALRRRNNKTKVFSKSAKKRLQNYPPYYQRNFHFQTDGYLGESSADIYEHQVEILFKGTADSMRRRAISLLKENKIDPESILEMAAGTGAASKIFLKAFPYANYTCSDLSEVYLAKAKKNLQKFCNLDFVRCAGESTPFKDNNFDLVFSVYLFHEVPLNIRDKILKESHRILKEGGHILVSDSIQYDDIKKMNWAIEDFPKNFHEPFYANYSKNSMATSLVKAGFDIIDTDCSLFTKSIVAKKINQH